MTARPRPLKLTTRQAVAYAAPCYVAEDTARRRFSWLARLGAHRLSVVLTVNVGLE